MFFNEGDIVSRNSYSNDTLFRIIRIDGDVAYLKGLDVRLYADSVLSDLKREEEPRQDDNVFLERVSESFVLDRSEYFYLPGKVLHIDGDDSYLKRCLDFYKKFHIMAYGICLEEDSIEGEILRYLEELQPDVVVITGHDAYYKRKGDIKDIHNYKNTENFLRAVKVARNYEKSHEKLTIVAGACQSNYEELIKAGATFASSPKRINIHALDPAIIATSVCLSNRNEKLDLINILEKTKYGSNGMGGVITNGAMYVGFPR